MILSNYFRIITCVLFVLNLVNASYGMEKQTATHLNRAKHLSPETASMLGCSLYDHAKELDNESKKQKSLEYARLYLNLAAQRDAPEALFRLGYVQRAAEFNYPPAQFHLGLEALREAFYPEKIPTNKIPNPEQLNVASYWFKKIVNAPRSFYLDPQSKTYNIKYYPQEDELRVAAAENVELIKKYLPKEEVHSIDTTRND